MLNDATQIKPTDGTLTAAAALRAAWATWITLGTVPMFCFLYLVWRLADTETPSAHADDGEMWFVIASIYLLMVVPVAFFWRSRLFATYWSGRPVRPSKYLFGMVSVWTALVLGGMFSLAGCLKYDSL